jgi:hypothetical protein
MKKLDNTKLLGLMRYWLFGTFLIVFVAITVYIGLFVGWSKALLTGLPIWGITGILCIAVYFGYKWYLSRKA